MMVNKAADWKEKVKRWNHGIELMKTTREEIEEYAITKTYTYEVDDDTDADLWEVFRDEFKGWMRDMFNNLNVKQLGALCWQLHVNKVFIPPREKNFTLAETLVMTLTEEERHE